MTAGLRKVRKLRVVVHVQLLQRRAVADFVGQAAQIIRPQRQFLDICELTMQVKQMKRLKQTVYHQQSYLPQSLFNFGAAVAATVRWSIVVIQR